MTKAQLRAIWEKTAGHCHFCGDPVDFRRRGYRRERIDGSWEVDHVVQRAKGGAVQIGNCLPACTRCNRLRWHRRGAALRHLLELGMIAKREVDRITDLGEKLIVLRSKQERQNAKRRGNLLLRRKGLRDPVAREKQRQVARRILIAFLRTHLRRSFTARELGRRTGLPKGRVRKALETDGRVTVTRRGRRYLFQGRPPKRRFSH